MNKRSTGQTPCFFNVQKLMTIKLCEYVGGRQLNARCGYG
nr:MAG TPA: hypothetical protein [Caudoviricetes sp.]